MSAVAQLAVAPRSEVRSTEEVVHLPKARRMDVDSLRPGLNKVHFLSRTMGGDLKLAGHLYLPERFDPAKKYPTIVFTGPFNQVKEQMGAVYGRKLAARGFAFLAFDHGAKDDYDQSDPE